MIEEQIKKANIEAMKLYTLAEIAPILGVTHRTLLNYIGSGKLKAVKIGGKWKVSEDNFKRFVNGEN